MFSDAEGNAKYPLYAFRKPVEATLETHSKYFDSIAKASQVDVIGHSLNEIDLDYFKAIASRGRSAKWVVYCYAESDWDHHPATLVRCGISRRNITSRSYPELE